MRIFLFFVDGVGLGDSDSQVNPLAAASTPALCSLLGGRPLTRDAVPYQAPGLRVVSTDPRLGVPGLPQSATGQTTIFTGKNASQAIGRHLNGYPTRSLIAILQAHSIFKQIKSLGGKVTFLNAFRPGFFEWLDAGRPLNQDRRNRPSASTVAALAAGVETLRDFDQLRAGEAVGFDIDHEVIRNRGYDVPPVDPAEAGRRAVQVAKDYDFALYEHFLTDKAGHRRDLGEAVRVLERLDQFLSGILEAMPADMLLVITSDHGNIEDMTVRTHTYNDVATILKGPGAEEAAERIRSLTDITPTLVDLLRKTVL